ncbi:dUTP diphosphatase [Blattabacterium cuenoti]|uniref:dUTP diphosphatase n=1 Tax=Blattabacterium cuenoti TaxID=1653831 RepID=UPI00163CF35A|nr:dUTP diphosphatase [Blattabacterium cuenoti]
MILKANIEKSIFINFLERKLIPTNLFFKFSKKIDKYFFSLKEEFIQAISIIHITKKKHNNLLYYYNMNIIIINPFYKTIIIHQNDRLARINLLKKVNKIKWKKCLTISNSNIRSNNGFGSTGI